jgi:hypothetical protein
MQNHLATMEALAALPPAARINFETHQQRLQDYIDKMAPGRPVSTQEGTSAQVGLWNTIKLMLTREGSEFVLHFGYMLDQIRQHRKGAFGERHLYRFFEYITLSPDDRTNFTRLLNLMVTTCDPSMRQLAMKQVDLRTALSGLRSEAQRQRVAAYYEL